VTVTRIHRTGGTGPVALELEDGGGTEADEVLFATGRRPLTDDIGLQTIGLEPGSWLEVDDTCAVRAIGDRWLYALGDVNHHALLTHQGKFPGRHARRGVAGARGGPPGGSPARGAACVPPCQPPVAAGFLRGPPAGAVGLTADQAERAG